MDIENAQQKQVPNTNFLDPGKAAGPINDGGVTVLEPIEKVKPNDVFNPDAPQLDSVGKPEKAVEPPTDLSMADYPDEATQEEPIEEQLEEVEEPEEIVPVAAPAFQPAPAYDGPSNFGNDTDIRRLKRNQLISWVVFMLILAFLTVGGYFWLNATINKSIQSVSESTEGKFDSLNQAATLGNLSVLNGASFDDIEVDGNTTLSELFVRLIKAETVSADSLGSKKVTIGEPIADGEETETDYTLLVNGVSFTSSLDVGKDLTVNGSTSLNGDVTMGELLASLVESGTITTDDLTAESAEVGGLVITGNTSAGGNFTVSGTTKTNSLEVGNSVSIGGNTVISGILSLSSKLFVSGDLAVDTSTLKVDSTNNRVGIGTSAPSALLDVNPSSNVSDRLVRVNGTTTFSNAIQMATTTKSATNGLSGVVFKPTIDTTGPVSASYGANYITELEGSGSISTARGLNVRMTTASGRTGAITSAWALNVETPSFSGIKPTENIGLRIQNQGVSGTAKSYGLYVEAQTGSTDSYAAAFVNGNVGIGITNPTALLHVDGDTIIAGSLTVGGHIVSENDSGTTTIAAGLAACTTPSVTMSGNDTAGTITITTGTACAVGGSAAAITFANAYGAAPRVVLSADNDNAANGNFFTSARTTTGVEIHTANTLTDSTTYTFNYVIIE